LHSIFGEFLSHVNRCLLNDSKHFVFFSSLVLMATILAKDTSSFHYYQLLQLISERSFI
jgi:hypothetical protein